MLGHRAPARCARRAASASRGARGPAGRWSPATGRRRAATADSRRGSGRAPRAPDRRRRNSFRCGLRTRHRRALCEHLPRRAARAGRCRRRRADVTFMQVEDARPAAIGDPAARSTNAATAYFGAAVLPPIFSHVPLATYFHSVGSLSTLAPWRGARVLGGAAVVLAGLGDAVAFFRAFLRRDGLRGDERGEAERRRGRRRRLESWLDGSWCESPVGSGWRRQGMACLMRWSAGRAANLRARTRSYAAIWRRRRPALVQAADSDRSSAAGIAACAARPRGSMRRATPPFPANIAEVITTTDCRAPMSFTVATYNIHKGFSHLTRRMVIHELREQLHGLSADILFLQEVQGVARPPRGPLPRLAGQAAARVHRRHRCGARSPTARTPSTGTATTATRVLSRFPIVAQENEDISAHAFESRGLLHCEIKLAARRADAALHQRAPRPVRARPAVADPRAVRAHPRRRCRADAPLIIAGDFNDWRRKARPHAHRRSSASYEVFEAGEGPAGAHVPVGAAGVPARPHLRARARRRSTRACTTRIPRARLSDHAALAATFELPRRRR